MENYTFAYPSSTHNNFYYPFQNDLLSSCYTTYLHQNDLSYINSEGDLTLPYEEPRIDGTIPSQVPPSFFTNQVNLYAPSSNLLPEIYIPLPINEDTNFIIGNSLLPAYPNMSIDGTFTNPTSPYRRINKTAEANRWTEEEDRKLRMLVKKYGAKKWAKIADCMRHRVGKQCRERWKNHLESNIKKNEEWTREEERVIIKMYQRGDRWAKISKTLKGRSENAIKNHWYATKRKLKGSPGSTPFERYIASATASYEDQQGEVDLSDEVQLWTNIDKCIMEEKAFLENLFG